MWRPPKVRLPDGVRELAIFVCGYLTYFGVRALTEGDVPRAMTNAADLVRLERWLGMDWEAALQEQVLRHPWLVDVANAVYVYGHWPVLIVGGVLLFRLRRPHYYRLRNAILVTGFIGLFVFALFPVAPPRLSGLGVVDTVTRELGGYRQILPRSLVNEYAAMPSFHAGWNILLGVVVFGATRQPLLRFLSVAGPAAMALAVVATANHFVIDVAGGAAMALAGLAVTSVAQRHRTRRTLDRADAAHAVRRGAPSGERAFVAGSGTPPGNAPDRGGRPSLRVAAGDPPSQDDRPRADPLGPLGPGATVDSPSRSVPAAGGGRSGR